MNPKVGAAVKKAIKDCSRTSEMNLAAFDVFECEDDSEVFVEAEISARSMSARSLSLYAREIAAALLTNSDEDEKVHLAVYQGSKIGRLTLDPRYRELSAEELRGKIGQALRIS